MKKSFKIILFSILIPLFISCNILSKTYKYSISTVHCTYRLISKELTNKEDFVVRFFPEENYHLDDTCFTVNINNQEVDKNNWNFTLDKFTLKSSAINGDLKLNVVALQDVDPVEYKVTYNYDSTKILLDEDAPTKVSYSNLNFRVFVLDNSGLILNIKIGNRYFDKYILNKEQDNVYLVTIEKQYINDDIVVDLDCIEGQITFNFYECELTNYESIELTYDDPLELYNLTYESFTGAFEIDKINKNTFLISSSSNNVSDTILKFYRISEPLEQYEIYIKIRHPKNSQEAASCYTFALMKGMGQETSIPLTFEYNNLESVNDFCGHLEIEEYLTNYDMNYSTGNNKTNTFKLINCNPHGYSLYASDFSKHESYYYRPLSIGNYELFKNTYTKTKTTLAVDYFVKSIEVFNSEELFFAIEHHYKPIFNSEPSSIKAEQIYNKAILWANEAIDDSLTDLENLYSLFNYFLGKITYDYYASKNAPSYPEWLKSPAYFLDGVFLNDGIAVCDGFSKAFALLSNIAGLDVVRTYGYDSENGGHAWDLAMVNDKWYLVCPTWAIRDCDVFDPKSPTYGFLDRNFSIFEYGSFLTTNRYFEEYGYNFSDQAFTEYTRSYSKYYSNIFNAYHYKNNEEEHSFYVTSKTELTSLVDSIKYNNLENSNLSIVFTVSDSNKISEWAQYAKNHSQISSSKYMFLFDNEGNCYIVYRA